MCQLTDEIGFGKVIACRIFYWSHQFSVQLCCNFWHFIFVWDVCTIFALLQRELATTIQYSRTDEVNIKLPLQEAFFLLSNWDWKKDKLDCFIEVSPSPLHNPCVFFLRELIGPCIVRQLLRLFLEVTSLFISRFDAKCVRVLNFFQKFWVTENFRNGRDST